MGLFKIYLILFATLFVFSGNAQSIDPNNIKSAVDYLINQRNAINEIKNPEEKIQKMLDLGLWKDAAERIKSSKHNTSIRILEAQLLIYQNNFSLSEKIIDSLLVSNRSNTRVLILKAELLQEAWKLAAAEALLKEVVSRNEKLYQAHFLLAQTYFLEGKSKELEQGISVLKATFGGKAGAELLEGELDLVQDKPKKADSAFQKGLMKEPLNADLRFYFGYTLWRNQGDGFLQNMENQWALCLKINPLHFLAHWHLGNGHTAKTYSDYYTKDDSLVKEKLKPFDKAIESRNFSEAIAITQKIGLQFPNSVFPLIYRASAYYMDPDPGTYLRDSAQNLYLQILKMKPHYGPANNGLAAVIKAKRIPFWYLFDSIHAKISSIKIPNRADFNAVIPEFNYYPEFIQKMVYEELHSARAYIPLLKKGNYSFHLIPLHHSLAETFNDPYFNQAPTFDHRRWMDIRGVGGGIGGGAVGLEYTEKAAYGERNVLLHEFVHTTHLTFFTDAERRRIRKLYYNAKKAGKCLDYYAAANEDEYMAQIYPAYFTPVSVHPQDFKSYNTASILKNKDPEAYAFVDSLVHKQNLFLEGKMDVFKDEWCELYMRLSESYLSGNNKNFSKAKSFLDSAAIWNKDYAPLLIAQADLGIRSSDFDLTDKSLKRAEQLYPNFSPIFEKNYELNQALEEAGLLDYASSFALQKSYLLKAISLESDPVVRSEWEEKLVLLYQSNVLIPDALRTLSNMIEHTEALSSYQIDQKNNWMAEITLQKIRLGYLEDLPKLTAIYKGPHGEHLFDQNYAQCLFEAGRIPESIKVLEKLFENEKITGSIDPEMVKNLAYFQALSGNPDQAQDLKKRYLPSSKDSSFSLVNLYLSLKETSRAETLFNALRIPHDFWSKSVYYETKGKLKEEENSPEESVRAYKEAMANNPFNYQAAKSLKALLIKQNQNTELSRFINQLNGQEVKPGPYFDLAK